MMNNIQLYTSNDGMVAYLYTKDIINTNISAEQVYSLLETNGIVFGINNEIIDQFPLVDVEQEKCLIAVGSFPKYEDEIKLIWDIETINPLQPQISESGRADFKHLHQFERVEVGQKIVTKILSNLIEAGTSVTGEEITKLDITSEIQIGKNISVSDDGLSLHSKTDGYVFWKDGIIYVDNMYQIRGSVDYHTGNVKFDGSVIIGGDVKSGFRIEATDDIFIEGSVEAADILSKNGDIVIQSGIVGQKKARVLSGGSIHCGYIQDATVGAKDDINITRYIINSKVTTGGQVIVDQNEGIIRGGRVSAGKKIIANEIGSENGIETDVMITNDRSLRLNTINYELAKQRLDLEKRMLMLNKKREFLLLLKDRVPNLSDNKLHELQSVQDEIQNIQRSVKILTESKSNLAESAENIIVDDDIVVKNQLHRTVHIKIGQDQLLTTDSMGSVRIYKDENDVQIEPTAET